MTYVHCAASSVDANRCAARIIQLFTRGARVGISADTHERVIHVHTRRAVTTHVNTVVLTVIFAECTRQSAVVRRDICPTCGTLAPPRGGARVDTSLVDHVRARAPVLALV